ncbi:hypothetical protein [Lentisalinibacter sediminis]|uniref:hypothetical protein n=1 Tax=Lentisalinibacter sediminis TaxID=2992237 RepID=UPI00386837E3
MLGAWHYDNPAADKGLGLLDYGDSGPGLNGRGPQKHYYYSSGATGRKDLERVIHRFSVNASTTDYEVRYHTDGCYADRKAH